MPWQKPPVVDFFREREWRWTSWNVGAKQEDLFGDLHERFNTTAPMFIQDPHAFHADVEEIARSSSTKEQFLARLQERKDQRLRELEEIRIKTFHLLLCGYDKFEPEEFFHYTRLTRFASLDCLYAFMASFLGPNDQGKEPSLDSLGSQRHRRRKGKLGIDRGAPQPATQADQGEEQEKGEPSTPAIPSQTPLPTAADPSRIPELDTEPVRVPPRHPEKEATPKGKKRGHSPDDGSVEAQADEHQCVDDGTRKPDVAKPKKPRKSTDKKADPQPSTPPTNPKKRPRPDTSDMSSGSPSTSTSPEEEPCSPREAKRQRHSPGVDDKATPTNQPAPTDNTEDTDKPARCKETEMKHQDLTGRAETEASAAGTSRRRERMPRAAAAAQAGSESREAPTARKSGTKGKSKHEKRNLK